MKKMKMIVSLILCFTMLCPAVTYASENEKINLNNFEEMKDIIIDSATDYYIVVSVPIEKAEMYQKQLENDSEFRESEIDEVLASLDTDSRAYPPGRNSGRAFSASQTAGKSRRTARNPASSPA